MKDPIGILLYGYNRKDALRIKTTLDHALEDDLFIISGSGKESWLVADILDKGPEDFYQEEEQKIIMFLGFNESQVNATLKDFPSPEVTRPIFCGLTVKNIQWTMACLIDHLREEHRQFTRQTPQPEGEA